MRGLIALAGKLYHSSSKNSEVGIEQREESLKWLQTYCTQADYIIAADGGLNHLYTLDVPPNLFIGDQDSIDSEAWSWGINNGMQQNVLQTHKNLTDGEAAFKKAIDNGCIDLAVICSLGDLRPDHVLGNYLLLSQLKASFGGTITATDGHSIAFFLHGPETLNIKVLNLTPAQRDGYISVLPLLSSLEGVTLSGLTYPLNHADIKLGSTLGISNERSAKTDEITIQVDGGSGVVLIVPKD